MHFCPQHWLLCHLVLYKFEFEFNRTWFPKLVAPYRAMGLHSAHDFRFLPRQRTCVPHHGGRKLQSQLAVANSTSTTPELYGQRRGFVRLYDKKWSKVYSFPYAIPIRCSPNGAVARKLEPHRYRRTLEVVSRMKAMNTLTQSTQPLNAICSRLHAPRAQTS